MPRVRPGVVSCYTAVKGLVVSHVPPPLLGFNNNVRHRGRIFHIQTEDSGIKNPRIVTHLFADGGRIIKTTRTEYTEHVARPDMQPFVRGLMKEQHKGMFTALRMGDLDKLLENVCGPFEQAAQASKAPPVAAPPVAAPVEAVTARGPAAADFETPPISSAFGEDERSAERADRPNALSTPNLRKVVPSAPPPTVIPLDVDVASLERLAAKPLQSLDGSREPDGLLAQGTPALRKGRANPSAATAAAVAAPATAAAATAAGTALTRPSSRFAAVPPKSASSIFGDGVISEQSLDEVILSYLAEDLDGSSE
jgi:hypothetical protein